MPTDVVSLHRASTFRDSDLQSLLSCNMRYHIRMLSVVSPASSVVPSNAVQRFHHHNRVAADDTHAQPHLLVVGFAFGSLIQDDVEEDLRDKLACGFRTPWKLKSIALTS